MRRTYHFLLATLLVAAPMPVAAQVSVDLNALNPSAPPSCPPPPPGSPATIHRRHHRMRHLARAARESHPAHPSALASATPSPAGPESIEHPSGLGPSFASLPALPAAVPPPPTPVLPSAPPPATHPASKPATPKPVEAASATPKPSPAPKAAAVAAAAPSLALPSAVPPPPPASASKTATRLAEATPAPPAAQPAPPKPTPDTLPKGADLLTLPFFVQDSDLPPAETAMLRDFAQRYGGTAEYTVRAFASAPAGDDDPSTPRRISLSRAQSVAAALMQSGVPPNRVRLLALGNAGGAPADRVEVIAMPPSTSHTTTDSSP